MKDDKQQNNPLNSFLEFQRSLSFPINFVTELKKSLDITTDNFRKIFEGISAGINTASIINQSFKDIIPDYRNGITEIFNKTLDFSKFYRRFIQLRVEEKKALTESGWIISPSLDNMPVSYIRSAVIKYNNRDKGKALTGLMKNYYGINNNWEKLESAIDLWKSNKFFTKQRMKIIYDCLWAHRNKKYTLSIPSLLPIIEGVASDYCKMKGLKINPKATTEKAKEVVNLLKLQGDDYESEILLYFIENQLYISTDKLKWKGNKNKKLLNRHGILHGKYSGYADCTRSLKCFLVLDVLSSLKKSTSGA